MLLVLKIMRAGNVRFFLKSQLPDAVSVLSHSPETPTKGKIYRRKIESKGNGSINLYWFHCMTMFLHPSLYDQNFQKSKFIQEKKILLSLPSFSLRRHKIALGVESLSWLHVCLASKPAYTNEKKFDWKPLNTRTWLLAQEEAGLQIAGMVGTKITLADPGSFPCPTAVLCQSCCR